MTPDDLHKVRWYSCDGWGVIVAESEYIDERHHVNCPVCGGATVEIEAHSWSHPGLAYRLLCDVCQIRTGVLIHQE